MFFEHCIAFVFIFVFAERKFRFCENSAWLIVKKSHQFEFCLEG